MATTVLTNLNSKGSSRAAGRMLLLRYRFLLIVIFQFIAAIISLASAFCLRFDLQIPHEYFQIFWYALPFHVVSRMLAYYYYGIYSGSWRFASMQDLVDTAKATVWGSLSFIVLMVFTQRLQAYPRSIIILEPILNIMLTGGARLVIRYYFQSQNAERSRKSKHILIVGAGKAGFLLLNEINTNPKLGIQVVGFVDDNPYKKNTNIQGVPVLAGSEEIPELVVRHAIDEIIIAIPSAEFKEIVRIRSIAESSGVKTLVLPSLSELIVDAKFSGQLRDVSCDDLLGRRAVKFCRESDQKLLEKEIDGKAVLVTGAGGSIGSELCRQVAQFSPRVLVLFERYENSLYELELSLRKEFPKQMFVPVIGDILDNEKLDRVIGENSIDLIYHAAAYKHVPMMEREPVEAVRNNVFGTLNVASLARKNKVGKFVLISTDKAVRPTSVMGATKRVAELIINGLVGDTTKFLAVRFGNVLGSNGSVIPLFKKQIAEGGPVTVTHPETSRYFMSISEAVQLVMIAGTMGNGGEVLLLDMGEPVKIVDLARKLIKLSGLEPEIDIDIVYTGLRSGEKLHEELYWQGEGIVPTENKKITMWKPERSEVNSLLSRIKKIEEYLDGKDVDRILALLGEIVPEARINNFIQKTQPAAQRSFRSPKNNVRLIREEASPSVDGIHSKKSKVAISS